MPITWRIGVAPMVVPLIRSGKEFVMLELFALSLPNRRFAGNPPEVKIGETEGEEFEHNEFFTRTDEWTNHWNAGYAPSDWHATPAELIERTDFWRVLNDCLSLLPERTASAFTLREVDGLTSEQICEALNITVSNLWVMLHRARLHLRNWLEINWFTKETTN